MIVNRIADGEVTRVDADADWQKTADLAHKVAGQAFETAGMSVEQLKFEAVKLGRPDVELTGKTTSYVNGWWDALVAALPSRKDSAKERLDEVPGLGSPQWFRDRQLAEAKEKYDAWAAERADSGPTVEELTAEKAAEIEDTNARYAAAQAAYNARAWRLPLNSSTDQNNDASLKQPLGGDPAFAFQPSTGNTYKKGK